MYMMVSKVLPGSLRHVIGISIFLISGIVQVSLASEDPAISGKTEYYHVEDGKVDTPTFIGWSLYHDACIVCHGVGGTGTEIAPDLTSNIGKLSPAEFRTKVLHRFSISVSDRTNMINSIMAEVEKDRLRESGELENMPRWEENPLIKAHILNIYGYLKARHDGVLDEGKPDLIIRQNR